MAVIISTLFMAELHNRSNKQESEQAPEEATLTVAADGELLAGGYLHLQGEAKGCTCTALMPDRAVPTR